MNTKKPLWVNKNKRIIFFSKNLMIGGMEKALVLLLNSLVSYGYKITLVLESKSGALLDKLDKRITVEEYKVSNSKFVLFRKAYNLVHRMIWTVFNYRKYDFSCNYATYSVIGSRLAEIASTNSALYVHSDYYEYFSGDEGKIKAFFCEQGIYRLKNIIFVSNESKKKIEFVFQEIKNKFCVISNLIADREILKLSEQIIETAVDKNKQYILFVGRLEESSKRISRLLETFEIVSKKSEEYVLWIIGTGDYKEKCMEFIEKRGLTEQIKMLGEIQNPYPYIKMADCLILTSDFEGFPVVYNECLVLKKPITSTIPVSDEFVDFGKYILFVDKKADSIANTLLEKKYQDITYDTLDIEDINKRRIIKLMEIINGHAQEEENE